LKQPGDDIFGGNVLPYRSRQHQPQTPEKA